MIDKLTSQSPLLLNKPLITRLCSTEGVPVHILTKIEIEEGNTPENLHLIAHYEKGILMVFLKAKSELYNTSKFSVFLLHVAEVANQGREKTRSGSFYAEMIKKLGL